MAAKKKTRSRPRGTSVARRAARLVPLQQRSRERFERILDSAAEIMAEKAARRSG